MKPNFLSLFCGCGGFDLGFIQAGFTCVAAFDNDPIAVEAHRLNLGPQVFEHDLTKGCFSFGPYGEIDVVLAGSPCQGFSTAGRRRIDDPRNDLLLAAGKRALALKPKVFIAENVRGVISGDHKTYWTQLKSMLKEAGYRIDEALLNLSDIGVPQVRKRMILVAWNTDADYKIKLGQKKTISLQAALDSLEGASHHNPTPLKKDSIHYKIAKKIKPGQKLSDVRGGDNAVHSWHIPEVFGRVTRDEQTVLEEILRLRRINRVRTFGDADPLSFELLERVFGEGVKTAIKSLVERGYLREKNDQIDLARGFNGKYRRLDPLKPSLTVDTRFGDPRYFLHPVEHRGFTVREAARIQGFPDDFIFSGTEVQQYKMIGNAVPPPLGKKLAEDLLNIILSKDELCT